MTRFRKFLCFRNVLVAATGLGSSFVVAHCSSQNRSESADFGRWDYNWDKREPLSLLRRFKRRRAVDGTYYQEKIEIKDEDIVKKSTKAVRNIILIRHGQYNIGGKTDSEQTLTSLGEAQAEVTGKRLAELGLKFDSIVCSDMTRAVQTANIIAKNLNQQDLQTIIQDPLLSEGPPALPDPVVLIEEWRPDLHEFFIDGARIEAGFRKHIHRATPQQEKDSYEIIVCHGNVIRYFFCRALQFPPEAWLRINICHTSLTYLSILPTGRVVLRSFSDAGHMPVEMQTVC